MGKILGTVLLRRDLKCCSCDLMSQVVSSKQQKLGLTQELSFSRISESYRLQLYPLCGIFYFPWHRHQLEGITGFVSLPKANLG